MLDRHRNATTGEETDTVHLAFSHTSQGIHCRSFFVNPTDNPRMQPFISRVTVLCKSLLVMHSSTDEPWLLYLHSDLAFFAFNHPFLEFSDSFHLISHK